MYYMPFLNLIQGYFVPSSITCVNSMEVSYIPIAKARGFTTHWINILIIPTPNKISSHRIILILIVVLLASCKLIASSLSEILFKFNSSSGEGSATSSPNKTLTEVSSSSASDISIPESGTDSPVSLS